MTLRRKLSRLVLAIADEAGHNADFAARLEDALGGNSAPRPEEGKRSIGTNRRGGRRAPAVVDPVALAHEGERQLRDALEPLSIERLHDIVAEYGMDPGKLVMKWKDRVRVTDRIVEIALARSTKGDAFRSS